jgi:1-acyl-sn-glycerol-3-phosphate acyltransferase
VTSGADSAYPAALLRRALTMPILFIALVLVVLLAPLLVLVGGTVDGIRGDRGWPSIRLVGFLVAYLGYETAGVIRALWIWISQPFARDDWTERNHRLQMWWVRSLIRAGGPILGLKIEMETSGPTGPGPLVVAARHVSLVDPLLPAYAFGVGADLRLRYVLTRGLRLDPCLDIAGHRLPNHFIDRDGSDSDREISHLSMLAADLDPDDAVVIFPEGRLFTEGRRARTLSHLERTGSDRLDTARSLQSVLLPRPRGTLALLNASPEADVVVMAHHGMEPLQSLKRLWQTLPLRQPVRLRMVRHARSTVPADDESRLAWLDQQWLDMDRWVSDQQARVESQETGWHPTDRETMAAAEPTGSEEHR